MSPLLWRQPSRNGAEPARASGFSLCGEPTQAALAKDHGPHIKDDALYEEPRKQGESKEKAAHRQYRAAGTLDHQGARLEVRSKADRYEEASETGIEGRSNMGKPELAKAIRARLTLDPSGSPS